MRQASATLAGATSGQRSWLPCGAVLCLPAPLLHAQPTALPHLLAEPSLLHTSPCFLGRDCYYCGMPEQAMVMMAAGQTTALAIVSYE